VGPPGFNNERIVDLSLHWQNSAEAAGYTSDGASLPGIGSASIRCPADRDFDRSKRVLRITPLATDRRTVASLTVFEAAGTTREHADNQRFESSDGSPIEVGLPPNGMIDGVIAVEPFAGGSAAPGALPSGILTLTSEWKTNDPDDPDNFCHVSAQAVIEGAP
jgi:hypothetical protein